MIASGWGEEVGVSYAPPRLPARRAPASDAVADRPEEILASPHDGIAIDDPLRAELAQIAKALAASPPPQPKAATLPLGGDKWGRDVLEKTIKGTETSLLVGLAAALLATFLGTAFGAQAGYFGGRVDDFFNWLYSVLTSIPYLLLILAIAAVLNQKGVTTVVLILGLTGWTGIFRLVRAEYLKHKVREYVQAADAIGASNAQAHVRAHPAQREPCRAGSTVAARRPFHQVRSHPELPRLRCGRRHRIVGQHAERSRRTSS